MTQNANPGCVCGTPLPDLRQIRFPDGDRVGLFGLDAVMEALYKEGKEPDDPTAMEMIERLREKNYISPSPSVQNLYHQALLSEYRRFFERKKR